MKRVLLALLGALVVREVVVGYLWFIRDGKTMTDIANLDSTEIKDEFVKEVRIYQTWLFRLLERLRLKGTTKETTISGSMTPTEIMAQAWILHTKGNI